MHARSLSRVYKDTHSTLNSLARKCTTDRRCARKFANTHTHTHTHTQVKGRKTKAAQASKSKYPVLFGTNGTKTLTYSRFAGFLDQLNVCASVCVCVCVCMCVRACVHTHIEFLDQVNVCNVRNVSFTHTHAHAHTCKQADLHTHTHTHMQTG